MPIPTNGTDGAPMPEKPDQPPTSTGGVSSLSLSPAENVVLTIVRSRSERGLDIWPENATVLLGIIDRWAGGTG